MSYIVSENLLGHHADIFRDNLSKHHISFSVGRRLDCILDKSGPVLVLAEFDYVILHVLERDNC